MTLSTDESSEVVGFSMSRSVERSAASTPSKSADKDLQRPSLQREGEFWTINFHGRTAQLADLRGLHYLTWLLRHPCREFHVLELVQLHNHTGDHPSSGGARSLRGCNLGDWLDAKAKTTYKQQLHDLRSELEEAKEQHDRGRVERLQRHIDFFAREISRSVGLFGHSRRSDTPAERARVNVSRAINAAIRRLARVHATAGEHLDRSIKTGTFCSYNPDPRSRIEWKV